MVSRKESYVDENPKTLFSKLDFLPQVSTEVVTPEGPLVGLERSEPPFDAH